MIITKFCIKSSNSGLSLYTFQVCKLLVECYGYTTKDLILQWGLDDLHAVEVPPHLQVAQFSLVNTRDAQLIAHDKIAGHVSMLSLGSKSNVMKYYFRFFSRRSNLAVRSLTSNGLPGRYFCHNCF